MKHARIIENVAVEVLDEEPAGFFHPALAAQFVPVPQSVVVGSRRVGSTWQHPATAPSAPPVAREPRRIKIIDWLRRFTALELIGYVRHADAARRLTDADYAAAAAGDIDLQMRVSLRLFLEFLDALRGRGEIELDHIETVQFLQLLVAMGVLDPTRPAEVTAP